MATPAITITFNLQNIAGATDAGATVVFTLQGYGTNIPRISGTSILADTSVTPVISNGTGSVTLWGNDVIIPGPSFTFYNVEVRNSAGATITITPYLLTGSGTFDLSTLTPLSQVTTAPIANPVVLNPIGTQTILNFPLSVPGLILQETTAPLGLANNDILYGDPSTHRIKMNNNNGTPDLVVGQNTTDTLVNKTLTTPTIANPTLTGALTFSEGSIAGGSANNDILYGDSTAHRLKMNNNNGTTDVVVGANTTDTLTNKTISSPTVTGTMTAAAITASGLITANGGVTVTSGQTLAADQVMPLNSSGTGGFWGIIVHPPNGGSAAASVVNSANQVWVYKFYLPFEVVIGKVNYNIFVTSASTTGDIGIYDTNGNRLTNVNGGINTGGSTGAASSTLIGAPVTLKAGFYYFAQTNTSSVPHMVVVTTDSTFTGIMNAGGSAVVGLAGNAASSGVLPSTLGGVTASTALATFTAAYFER